MDILNEIGKLPHYLYVFEDRAIILGGQSAPNNPDLRDVRLLWEEIRELYEKPDLSDWDKRRYTRKVKEMANRCQSGIMNNKELQEKIAALSDNEQKEIEWQIDMYKRGRSYWKDYAHIHIIS